MNKENLNKKIEETQKKFEKMFGGNCSYHEEDSWNGGKNGIFTIKFRKNIEILNGLERAIKKMRVNAQSFLKVNYPPLIEVGASRFLDKAIT